MGAVGRWRVGAAPPLAPAPAAPAAAGGEQEEAPETTPRPARGEGGIQLDGTSCTIQGWMRSKKSRIPATHLTPITFSHLAPLIRPLAPLIHALAPAIHSRSQYDHDVPLASLWLPLVPSMLLPSLAPPLSRRLPLAPPSPPPRFLPSCFSFASCFHPTNQCRSSSTFTSSSLSAPSKSV